MGHLAEAANAEGAALQGRCFNFWECLCVCLAVFRLCQYTGTEEFTAVCVCGVENDEPIDFILQRQ